MSPSLEEKVHPKEDKRFSFRRLIAGLRKRRASNSLASNAWAPEGAWLAGFGLILLGLNVARRRNGLKMHGFGIAVGAAAFFAGMGRIAGSNSRSWPFSLSFLERL